LRENSELRSKVQELQEYYERRENEPNESDLQLLIAEKDRTIDTLKKMVQQSRKEDDRKQQQINDLQARLQSDVAPLPADATPDLRETVARLEAQTSDLEERVQNSQANKETELKNQRLSKLLDRSNKMYTALLEQNRALLAQQEATEPKVLAPSQVIQLTIQPEARTSRPPPKIAFAKMDDKTITDAYLKRVLLQFFLQDDATREPLIPLILELVGCTEQHILAAKRQWQRSTHAIPRSSGFFRW
jgi:uncharacterized coiled-coil protein SlyX